MEHDHGLRDFGGERHAQWECPCAMRTWRPTNGARPWPNSTKSRFLRLPCAYSGMALRRGVTTALIQWWKGRDSNPRPRHYEPGRRIGLSPLSGRYLIVGTSFYYRSAGRDGVAAIWAPKSTVGHRRVTRNSRALVQPRGSLLGQLFKDPSQARALRN
jgi:hypothetical protein